MKTVVGLLMIATAALFFFGAAQHAGVSMGRFHEPLIIPSAIVEFLCGLCLLLGAIALFLDWRMRWRIAFATNLVALGGVLLGIAALAAGAHLARSETTAQTAPPALVRINTASFRN